MVAFIIRRFLLALLTIWELSMLTFLIITLPPGDLVSGYIEEVLGADAATSQAAAQLERSISARALLACGSKMMLVIFKSPWPGRGSRGVVRRRPGGGRPGTAETTGSEIQWRYGFGSMDGRVTFPRERLQLLQTASARRLD